MTDPPTDAGPPGGTVDAQAMALEPTHLGGARPGGSSDPPALGIVIVSYNTRDLLDACLVALAAALGAGQGEGGPGRPDEAGEPGGERRPPAARIDAEVWVVDNASPDGSAELVAERHPWAHLERLDRNAGFTAANNIPLRRWIDAPAGAPEHVLLLNPDTEISRAALDALRSALAADPSIGVVGPALVYPDGRFQHSAFRFPGVIQTTLDLWPVDRLADRTINGRYPRARYAEGRPFEVDFVLGACMLARGSALRDIGPLDEGFFMYCEEIDWCLRLRSAGWRRVCVPAARVLHHAGASSRGFRHASFVHLWRSRRRLARKHFGPVRRALFEAVLAAALLQRSLLDRLALALGRLDPSEAAARRSAYRAVRGLDP